ncbi:MAG: peptide-methionine (R)-S-oxide reductase MsrB [Bifidobacteriaceae bacterium]|jgi:peptide methionine sulfoxide reductase msrA/msrB|nr:peptide-methionine (R)-S-oxide reductase MsrB [Bifidobacteriaceae bacterium]
MSETIYQPKLRTLFFAGGCFWGLEKFFQNMPWVEETRVGYANGQTVTASGDPADVNYRTISELEFAETVEVTWNADALSIRTLLERFFSVIDPTSLNRQGHDQGTQYRTGVYYRLSPSTTSTTSTTATTTTTTAAETADTTSTTATTTSTASTTATTAENSEVEGNQGAQTLNYDDDSISVSDLEVVLQMFAEVEQQLESAGKTLQVELQPLQNFFVAEDYHQDYLDKNPQGYCHIPLSVLQQKWPLIDQNLYPYPGAEAIRERVENGELTKQQFEITQNADTEAPFTGEYDHMHDAGIYVDIITGEPLFVSSDKFDSGCGWPSFSKPIDPDVLVELPDDTIPNRHRTEIRSAGGNSHLGHVFTDGPPELTGLRYCINSASLRFIPQKDLISEGYGYLKATNLQH